jgi:hypothetical protein
MDKSTIKIFEQILNDGNIGMLKSLLKTGDYDKYLHRLPINVFRGKSRGAIDCFEYIIDRYTMVKRRRKFIYFCLINSPIGNRDLISKVAEFYKPIVGELRITAINTCVLHRPGLLEKIIKAQKKNNISVMHGWDSTPLLIYLVCMHGLSENELYTRLKRYLELGVNPNHTGLVPYTTTPMVLLKRAEYKQCSDRIINLIKRYMIKQSLKEFFEKM